MTSALFCVILLALFFHSTTTLPLEPEQHDELKEEITNVKGQIKELFNELNKLSESSDVDDNVERQKVGNHKMCLSQECVAASHKLFQNMDVSINPCDDFYQFSCGNFIKQSIIPDDKGMLSSSFSPLRNTSKRPFQYLVINPGC